MKPLALVALCGVLAQIFAAAPASAQAAPERPVEAEPGYPVRLATWARLQSHYHTAQLAIAQIRGAAPACGPLSGQMFATATLLDSMAQDMHALLREMDPVIE